MLALLPSFTLAFTHCNGCEDVGPSQAPEAGVEVSIAPWTFGAARTQDSVVLPPPCVEREPTLKTVLDRNTRLAAEPHTLGRLWAAEGPAVGNTWHPTAAAIIELAHGSTTNTRAPWSDEGQPLLASDGSAWWLGYGTEGAFRLFRDGEDEPTPATGRPHALACGGGRCALLERTRGPAVWVGRPASAEPSWTRTEVGDASDEPVAVSLQEDHLTVLVKDSLRVRFIALAGEEATEVAAIAATTRLIATSAHGPRAVLLEPAFQLVDGCASEGGVVAVVEGRAPVRLLGPEPPSWGRLTPLGRGLLVTWLAPLRCRSRRSMLYATVLTSGAEQLAPVTTVGEIDAVHLAARGDDVDLWLHDEGDNTLTWVRARCR